MKYNQFLLRRLNNMLNNIIQTFKKPSRLILLIGSILVFALTALSEFGNIGGEFFPVFIGIIVLVATLAATAAVPVLLVMKKEEAAKIVFSILAGYWLISKTRGELATSSWVVDGLPLLYVAAAVFSVFFGLCLLAVIVLAILQYVLKKEFRPIIMCVLAGALLMAFVALILWLVVYGKQDAAWTVFIDEFNAHLVIPVTLIGGILYFFIDEAPIEKKEAKKEEPKVEEQPAEQPAEQPQEQPEIAGENQ